MILVLDISTSLIFWRCVYPVNRKPQPSELILPSDECACTEADVLGLAPEWATGDLLSESGGVLHALCFNTSLRRNSASHHVHVWTQPVPQGSFYVLSKSVYVASPGFVFLGAASLLNENALTALGDELCGLYSFDRRAERGFRTREEPLITAFELRRFIEGARGARGQKRALSALDHVVDRSASPMETLDEMLMCLPYRRGGYGLPKPVMNVELSLTDDARKIAASRTCKPDMYWKDGDLDVEHHGYYDHSQLERQRSDRARVNALKEMGLEVIELTRDQVGDPAAFEVIVLRIARIVGKRVIKAKRGDLPERCALRRDLFEWNAAYGRIR